MFPLLPMGLEVGTDTGPRPPASSTGSPTAQTLATTLLYPTHIDGHRGNRGGIGERGGGVGQPPGPRERAGGAELSSAAGC